MNKQNERETDPYISDNGGCQGGQDQGMGEI